MLCIKYSANCESFVHFDFLVGLFSFFCVCAPSNSLELYSSLHSNDFNSFAQIIQTNHCKKLENKIERNELNKMAGGIFLLISNKQFELNFAFIIASEEFKDLN